MEAEEEPPKATLTPEEFRDLGRGWGDLVFYGFYMGFLGFF